MSEKYNQKIEAAENAVKNHYLAQNLSETDAAEKAIAFVQNLKQNGGTSDEALRACSFQDLTDLTGIPLLLAKSIALTIFRDKEEKAETTASQPQFIGAKKVATMSLEDLVKAYDPTEPTNPVGKRLSDISKGKKFVVFSDGGKVNVAATLELLNEIKLGHDQRESFFAEGRPRQTYKVGDRPGVAFDENPIYKGRALRPNGDCDQMNRSWQGISLTVRQLVYLAIHVTREIKINSVDDAHRVLDMVVNKSAEDAEKLLRERYQKTSIEFDILREKQELPSLKIERTANAGNGRQDPFTAGHRQW